MKLFVFSLLITSVTFAINPEKGYKAVPSDYGVIYKELTITVSDGARLKAWFYPAQDTSGISNSLIGRVFPVPADLKKTPREYPAKNKLPTVIICDGDAGNMSYQIFYAYHFFTKGFNVLTFDWRGFGNSSEFPMNKDQLCYSEFLKDYNTSIDFLKTMAEVDTNRMCVMGFSTGAYLSFAMLKSRNDVKAFCGRALITNFEDLISVISVLDTTRKFTAPMDYPENLLPVNAAPNVTKPVFLVVGENDRRTPPWMSRKINDLLKGGKELWIVPGAEHGGMKAPELVTYPEFFTRVLAFFTRVL